MEVIDKNTFKIKDTETLTHILCNYLQKKKETDFAGYKRSHFLEENDIHCILKLYIKEEYKEIEPKEKLKEIIQEIKDDISILKKCL